ncbi:hypothetical protein DPX16_16441 [Anabarilius grahami]|uniref:Uncharacterized protein n=1 Tax=Anabarilius grahami TaxID=495550 RepID=A0A3N0XXN5_ANAGA|nr:hypothetical protein DPX16_16441 [Anabarilius grahami]
MTKLITETPDHPIPFLIGHLQTKQESPGRIQRTLSGSAALWAESSSEYKGTRRDSRGNEKPWQIHPKKPKKSKSDLAVSNISPPSPESKSLPRSILRPTWDWRTKPESRDFNELNHILQESKKLGKALENLSRSIAVSDDFDLDPQTYNSVLRPRVVGEWVGREEEDSDPLAAEMLQPPIPRAKTEGWASKDNSPVGSLKMETKGKGLKQQQQNHKKLLAAMLSQDSFDSMPDSAPSVTEDEMEDEDDAMELLGGHHQPHSISRVQLAASHTLHGAMQEPDTDKEPEPVPETPVPIITPEPEPKPNRKSDQTASPLALPPLAPFSPLAPPLLTPLCCTDPPTDPNLPIASSALNVVSCAKQCKDKKRKHNGQTAFVGSVYYPCRSQLASVRACFRRLNMLKLN